MHEVGDQSVAEQRNLLSRLVVEHHLVSPSAGLPAGKGEIPLPRRRVRPRFVLERRLTLRPPGARAAQSERGRQRVQVIGPDLAQGHQGALGAQHGADRPHLGHRPQPARQAVTSASTAARTPRRRRRSQRSAPGSSTSSTRRTCAAASTPTRLCRHHRTLDLVQAAAQPRREAVRAAG